MNKFFRNIMLSGIIGVGFVSALAQEAAVRININTASEEQLLTIPGVGAKIADELMEYRPYSTKEQFEKELGKYLDAEALAALESHVTIGLANMNTSTEEELLTIPGVGPKVVDEIMEYRDYTTLEQFETELGKYFDEQTIRDLEFYITLE
jgi:DNA uptake protein ComE-like DNA-binding protein